MSIDATTLPSELLTPPQPLIGFCGLDITKNTLHKTIWDAFNANRKTERPAVQFKCLPTNYEFPVAKPKRASYEWYHPKGILKRNWMLKHLHVLPAVVVIFKDMEWNDAQWSEKQLQCASAIQGLKNVLQERNTRICLVLVQKTAPLPPGEDMLASERAITLTTACGINNKMLFLLPHTEHLLGYVLRLESAFLDLAQSYYNLMSKRIRTHRDQLTAAHVTLKIRHQFKLGFVAEIRQDYSTALKHYTQAYSTLDEIRITETNCLEMKTISGFLNYKICRLMFKLKVPRDSINHFTNHMDKYRNRIGNKDLLFEHHAWLSSQHNVFAELFCDAIKNGLPALQTQHPGIYFNKAAEHIMKRREAFLQSSVNLLSPNDTNSSNSQKNNTTALYTEFFGIRMVKAGDPVAEQQLLLQLRENEKSINYSTAIINLLGQAMAQFKIYKCLRFRKKLAIDMAEEYFKSGDHAKALTLYSLMLPDYRQDQWTNIFCDVLLKTLKCSLLAASVGDFVSCSLEALSLKIYNDPKERITILENLWKVFQGIPPLTQFENAPEVRDLWEKSLQTVKSPIQIDLDKFDDIFEMCATFEKVELKNDEAINVHLIFRLLTDVPIKLHSFAILLTDGRNFYRLTAIKYQTFQNMLELRESHKKNLNKNKNDDNDNEDHNVNKSITINYHNMKNDCKLEPDIYYQFIFTTEAQQFFENTQFRVARIEVQMGTDKLSAMFTKSCAYTRNAFRHHNLCKNLDDNITINTSCYIAPTFHLVTQSNLGNEKILVNEFYPVMTTVTNPHNIYLQNVGLNISIPEHLRNQVYLTTDISPSRQKLYSHIQIDIGELQMQSSNTVTFYIYSLVPGKIELQQKIWYLIDATMPKLLTSLTVAEIGSPNSNESSPDTTRTILGDTEIIPPNIISNIQIDSVSDNRLRKTRDELLNVICDLEFKFLARLYTLNRQPLTKCYRGENFLFRVNIEVQSQSDLDILETYFICDHNLVQSTYTFKRKKFSNTYRIGDQLEDVIVLRSNSTTDEWISAKDFERSKNDPQLNNLNPSKITARRPSILESMGKSQKETNSIAAGAIASNVSPLMNRSLMSKIPTNMTIISNSPGGNITANPNTSILSLTAASDDDKLSTASTDGKDQNPQSYQNHTQIPRGLPNSRLVYNKAMDAIQTTGHCRGFIKTMVTVDPTQQQQQQQQQSNMLPNFGVYCVKWRRHGKKDENESKFIISGIEIHVPPLNIYCSIEEKLFVKMPMTFRVVIKNSTHKVLHLIATLSISNTDNFICSGHKQLDISIFACSEKELIYNLYPLCVGWQTLPEFSLVYNTQVDPSRDETQNHLLYELVQRALPKSVFVLPPLKQQTK